MTSFPLKANRSEDFVGLKIGLFIPCYIDLIYPEVGIATLELLEIEPVV